MLLFTLSIQAQNIPQLRRIEGQGNDRLIIDLVPGMHDSILNSPNHKYAYPLYDFNAGPVKVDVFNPALTPGGNYSIYFNSVNPSAAKWTLVHYGIPNDTIFGDSTVSASYTQIIPQWGMSVWAGPVNSPGGSTLNSNGFLEATMTFSNSNHWLSGIADADTLSSFNWIRSGTYSDTITGAFNDYPGIDDAGYYETVLGGTWAPYRLAAAVDVNYPPYVKAAPAWNQFQSLSQMSKLSSVDIVITSNPSKWTRCVVLEAGWNSASNQGSTRYMDMRMAPSVDKNGQPGDGVVTSNPNDADYINATGMSWFPGYAINVETGERLNMAFAESSSLPGENGSDMIWNPTSNIVNNNGDTVFGGMHYIYVFSNSAATAFDHGAYFRNLLQPLSFTPYTGPSASSKRIVYSEAMWVNIPMLVQGKQLLSSDVSIRLRVAKPYNVYNTNGVNNGNPMYSFNSITLMNTPEGLNRTFLDLFPNPVEDEINIRGLNGKFGYTIIDMLGRTVMTGLSEGDKVHVGQLKRGVYVIRLTDETSAYTLKFVRK